MLRYLTLLFFSLRLFGIKCARCNVSLSKSDFVMRARTHIYHIDCFRCVACARQLLPGDEFALGEEGLCCKSERCALAEKKTNTNGHTPNGHNTTTNGGTLQITGNPGEQLSRCLVQNIVCGSNFFHRADSIGCLVGIQNVIFTPNRHYIRSLGVKLNPCAFKFISIRRLDYMRPNVLINLNARGMGRNILPGKLRWKAVQKVIKEGLRRFTFED